MLRRALPALAVPVLALALLSACSPTPTPVDPDTGPNPTGEPTGEPAPSLTAQPTGTPIDATCDELVTADTLYLYNPNFTAVDDYTPRDGSAAASALTYDGIACRWQNQTSGQNVDVSAAQLDEGSLTALKNAAFESSELVPTYGDEAYFTVEGGVGIAQVFQGPYWIVVESPVFFEPGDATEIVQSILDGLAAA